MDSIRLLTCETEKSKTKLIQWIRLGLKEESIADWTTGWNIPPDTGIDDKWRRGPNLLQMTEAEQPI